MLYVVAQPPHRTPHADIRKQVMSLELRKQCRAANYQDDLIKTMSQARAAASAVRLFAEQPGLSPSEDTTAKTDNNSSPPNRQGHRHVELLL